jgi:hypothetical protein
MPRHSGLDPESSSFVIIFEAVPPRGEKSAALRAGCLRFWIPGQARNDEVLGFRRASGLASAGEICFLSCGAFAPERLQGE